MNGFVNREGSGRAKTNAYISGGRVGKDGMPLDVGMIFSTEAYACPAITR